MVLDDFKFLPSVTAASVLSQICLQSYLLFNFVDTGLLDTFLLSNSQYVFITTIVASYCSFVLLPFLSKEAEPSEVTQVFTGALIYLLLSIVVIAIVSLSIGRILVKYYDLASDIWYFYRIFLAATFFKSLNILLSSYNIVFSRKHSLVLYTFIENISILAALIILSSNIDSTKLLATSYLGVLILLSVILLWNAFKRRILIKPDFNKSKHLILLASWNLLSTASSRGLILIDRFILAKIEGTGTISIFNYIIQFLKSGIAVFGSKIGLKSLLIKIGSSSEGSLRNRVREIQRLSIIAIVAYWIGLLIIFLLPYFLENFETAIDIAMIKGIFLVLFAYFIFGTLNSPITGMLYHYGEIKWMTKSMILVNIISLILKLILFYYLGLFGLSVSYVLSSAIVFCIMNYRLNRILSFNLLNEMRGPLLLILLGFIISVGITSFLRYL